jgi:hypothetical protein
MFAGLPGIGVGTLFYILMAFWMPVREIPRVIRGTSTIDNWKLILRQLTYSVGIIVTVMFAEKVMLWLLGDHQVKPLSPATWVNAELGARASGSFLAAPIMASLLLLAGVVLSVELLRAFAKPAQAGAQSAVLEAKADAPMLPSKLTTQNSEL